MPLVRRWRNATGGLMRAEIKKAFDKWWSALTLKGDPLHIPNKFTTSFEGGYLAGYADCLKEIR